MKFCFGLKQKVFGSNCEKCCFLEQYQRKFKTRAITRTLFVCFSPHLLTEYHYCSAPWVKLVKLTWCRVVQTTSVQSNALRFWSARIKWQERGRECEGGWRGGMDRDCMWGNSRSVGGTPTLWGGKAFPNHSKHQPIKTFYIPKYLMPYFTFTNI